jgi:hypothetical protein
VAVAEQLLGITTSHGLEQPYQAVEGLNVSVAGTADQFA